MNNSLLASAFVLFCGFTTDSTAAPVWPPPPAAPRVEYVTEIRCADLERETGFLGRLVRGIAGRKTDERPQLPFDVLVSGSSLFMICQGQTALLEIDEERSRYRRHECPEQPLVQPIALCAADGAILVSDSGSGTIYRFDGGRLTPWVDTGLVSPTGIAAIEDSGQVFVVDTGVHAVKVFDFSGRLLRTMGRRDDHGDGLNFPTFITNDGETLLVNDTLNYEIKRFSPDGELLAVFGREGDVPGSFARPKDLSVDDSRQIYVVDNLHDNLQVFTEDGRLLLVVGGRGRAAGEFWSPVGIDIAGDLIYVADTFNHRIQVLRFLGG